MRIGKYMSDENRRIVRELMPLAGAVLDMRQGRYTAQALSKLPTLSKGQSCDLKIDTGSCRVWLSRCSTLDGMPFDNMVTVEMFLPCDEKWRTLDTYAGGVIE